MAGSRNLDGVGNELAGLTVRALRADDRAEVLAELSSWSPALDVCALLPPPLFAAQHATSMIVHDAQANVVAVLIGMVPADPGDVGYIHFVWVSPHLRRLGLAKDLYERALTAMRTQGASKVEAATAVVNHGAVDFHRHLGFEVIDLPAAPGPAAVLMIRNLTDLSDSGAGSDESDAQLIPAPAQRAATGRHRWFSGLAVHRRTAG